MALRIYRTEAVVLRQRRLGDAGKICVLFTPNLGRIEAVAKGVRRPRSKLAGHLEPLTRVSLLLAKGRSLDTITQAQALDSFAPLREEIERLSRALYVAELVDRMTDAAPDVGGLYRLLVDTIERLGATEALDLAVRWFEMRLLMEQGYQPNLERCVRCNAELALEGNGFAALAGGVVCPGCREAPGSRPLSGAAFKLLRYMQRRPFAEVARVRVDAVLGRELEMHLRQAVQAALDQEVKAGEFVDAVRATSPVAAQRSGRR